MPFPIPGESGVVHVNAAIPDLDELRELVTRFEAAAAQLRPGLAVEGETMEFATATLRTAGPEAPGLGAVAAAVLAGAALAGSTTRRVSRRALLTFGFLRGRR